MPHIVSIIMPSYNAEKTIDSSIQSVIDQTYENWELIIVDDFSSDGTRKIIDRYTLKNPKIRSFYLEKNSGSPSKPRNIGLKNSTGSYVAFLDADDLWKPEKLKVQIQFIRDNNSMFSCSSYEVIDHKNNHIGYFTPPKTAVYNDLLRENSIGCLTAILDSRLLKGREFPNCGHEDYALWLDILKNNFQANGIQKNLATYRYHKSSVSSNKLKVLKYFFYIYYKREGGSFLNSIFYTIRYAWNTKNKYKRSGCK